MRQTIDLRGPDGNAFVLLGAAKRFATQLGLDGDKICDEMRTGDYDHLVSVFSKHFGGIVDIVGFSDPDDEDDDEDDDYGDDADDEDDGDDDF
jgi:hypothetical protein